MRMCAYAVHRQRNAENNSMRIRNCVTSETMELDDSLSPLSLFIVLYLIYAWCVCVCVAWARVSVTRVHHNHYDYDAIDAHHSFIHSFFSRNDYNSIIGAHRSPTAPRRFQSFAVGRSSSSSSSPGDVHVVVVVCSVRRLFCSFEVRTHRYWLVVTTCHCH